MHIISSLILSSIKKLFRTSIWADNEEMLRCKRDNYSVGFLSNGFENDLAKVLEEPSNRTVFRPLLDNVEKGISIA